MKPLGLTAAASSKDTAIQKKIHVSRKKLIVPNEEMGKQNRQKASEELGFLWILKSKKREAKQVWFSDHNTYLESTKNWKDAKVTKKMEVPTNFYLKGTCATVGDSIISGLKENILSKNGSIKVRSFPLSTVDDMFF